MRLTCKALTRPFRLAIVSVTVLAGVVCAAGEDADRAVYVMTNDAKANSIMVFDRDHNGMLTHTADTWTHGQGSGGSKDPLGSQGALTLSGDRQHLLAVNAGSNEISLLAITEDGLRFRSKAQSRGTMPVSVAIWGDLVYVLNAGGAPNIAGFRLYHEHLWPIKGAWHVLPGGVASGPAQIGFTPEGNQLVVTEKDTNKIDVFNLDEIGRVTNVVASLSSGATPFGFDFGRHGVLVVSEAAGGAVNGSTVSSYEVEDENPIGLEGITKSLPNGQTATCWVVVTHCGIAFTANTQSDTISSFRLAKGGALSLIDSQAGAVEKGSIPTDMALSKDGRFLYVIGAATNSLIGFRVEGAKLIWVTAVSGIPVSAQGIASR